MIFAAVLPLIAVTSALAKPTPAPAKGPLKLTGRSDMVHDPSVAQKADGSYIVVSTSPQGMEIRTSKNKEGPWSFDGNIWPTPPDGVAAFNKGTNDLWAPDIHREGDTFHLYWSASSFGSQESGIFYATSKTGAPGSFDNKGLVFSSKTGDPYNSIDPQWVKDGSREYMSFGSFWGGIFMVELDRKTGKVLEGAQPVHLAQRDISVAGAVEGPSIFKKGKWWYLVDSFDSCCRGLASTYNSRVVRSKSITGPYYDKDGVPALQGGGSLLLASEGDIIGPGGGSVYKDMSGEWDYYHHYYTAYNSSLSIRPLDFTDGWPVAR